MEEFIWILVSVLGLLVILGFLASISSIVYNLLKYLVSEIGYTFAPIVPSKKNREYLENHFPFFKSLPKKSQEIFLKRVAYFITAKKFIPRQLTEVTTEMKVLISAAAIQLTFGFPHLSLSYFTNILVYPDTYYSAISKKYHKGEVNPRLKAIVLSWKYFVEGYLKKDGRNLGLHEMAHALRLENRITNQEYDFLDADILKEWEVRAQRTMEEIQNGTEHFFRQYGATNNEEFFAVAVENFFERPTLFLEKHPKTYQTLCRLLKQDPALLEIV